MTATPSKSRFSSAQMRLRRHADFQAVYKLARKQYAKEMSFFFAQRGSTQTPMPVATEDQAASADGQKPLVAASSRRTTAADPVVGPRVGLTVGKVLGKAHDRNRIKRRLRAAIRQHAALLDALSVDVVLHPRRTLLTLDWKIVEAEVAQAFRTVRRLADKPQTPSPRQPRTPGKAGTFKRA